MTLCVFYFLTRGRTVVTFLKKRNFLWIVKSQQRLENSAILLTCTSDS